MRITPVVRKHHFQFAAVGTAYILERVQGSAQLYKVDEGPLYTLDPVMA